MSYKGVIMRSFFNDLMKQKVPCRSGPPGEKMEVGGGASREFKTPTDVSIIPHSYFDWFICCLFASRGKKTFLRRLKLTFISNKHFISFIKENKRTKTRTEADKQAEVCFIWSVFRCGYFNGSIKDLTA